MVDTLSALGATESQDDLVVHRSELGELRFTLRIQVTKSLNHLGLQHANLETKRDGRHIIQQ